MSENLHPVPQVVGALHGIVEAAAAAQRVEGDQESVIRVALGDPGEFAELKAIGIALATTPIEPVEDRQVVRGLRKENHDFDVVCLALARLGPRGRLQCMAQTFELVDLVREQLELPDNRRLGLDRVVETVAGVGRTAFSWVRDRYSEQGLAEFAVRIKAYRPR